MIKLPEPSTMLNKIILAQHWRKLMRLPLKAVVSIHDSSNPNEGREVILYGPAYKDGRVIKTHVCIVDNEYTAFHDQIRPRPSDLIIVYNSKYKHISFQVRVVPVSIIQPV